MAIVAVIGPSGAGKSTLVDKYVAEHPAAILHKSVTTRPKRGAGDTSHTFLTEAQFAKLEQQGQLIQSVAAYGVQYGLPPLPDDTYRIVFVMIRHQFVDEFKQHYPSAHIVQIEAGADTLASRLHARGDSNRIDKSALTHETESGREKAEAVIVNAGPIEQSYKELVAICKTFL